MPTYEDECVNCGIFKEFHGVNTTWTRCPKCSGEVGRLISQNSSIIFKGSGFHVTDYRSGDYNSKAAAEKSEGKASSLAKSESKAS